VARSATGAGRRSARPDRRRSPSAQSRRRRTNHGPAPLRRDPGAPDLRDDQRGTRRTWTVAVVVPLSVLEGGDFEVAEIPGSGPILPSTARDLAAHAGHFEQITVDDNGEVIAVSDQQTITPAPQPKPHPSAEREVEPEPEVPCLIDLIRRARKPPVIRDLSSDYYRPSSRLARFVQARDQRCCFLGCKRPAAGTDKDHLDPWPHGRTSPENMHCLCRHHHRAKHTVFTVLKDHDGHHLDHPRPAVVHATTQGY
jgi:hypothetical protein